MEYFTTNRPGDISSRLNNDVNDLADIFSDTVVAITSNVLILASTVFVVFTLDWHLALLAIAIVPLFIPPAWWVGKLRQEIVKQAQEKRSDLHTLVADTMGINGFLIRRIFGHLPAERARYAKAGREFGQIQTMPTEYNKFAVDGDHDGHRNLMKSVPDVVASAGNYIQSLGWRRGEPWLREVRVGARVPWDQADLSITHPVSQWKEWGVTATDGKPLDGPPASLVLPMCLMMKRCRRLECSRTRSRSRYSSSGPRPGPSSPGRMGGMSASGEAGVLSQG